jgi:hypothetical protein
MPTELGLRSQGVINSYTWLIVLLFCVCLIACWLFLQKKSKKNSEKTIKHQRFPLGQNCSLITIEQKGKLFSIYESTKGLVLLDTQAIKDEQGKDQ